MARSQDSTLDSPWDVEAVNCDRAITNYKTEICGNRVIQINELCDDGNHNDGDGCDANCNIEACGNGIVQVNEECD